MKLHGCVLSSSLYDSSFDEFESTLIIAPHGDGSRHLQLPDVHH
jgi:hypothetical protein